MKNINQTIQLIESSVSETRENLSDEHMLMKNLLELLLSQIKTRDSFILFCTQTGLILNCYSGNEEYDLSGHIISGDALNTLQENYSFNYSVTGYILISNTNSKSILKKIQTILNTQQKLFKSNESSAQYILNCLDSMDNAICVYDKGTSFLYGNTSYCKTMHIADRDASIGMNVHDIMKKSDVKIMSTKTGSSNFKMLDVINTGNKILDWEIMIESQVSGNEAQYVSNNMYPVKNSNGTVEAIVETFHSHRLDLAKTKKLMGLSTEYTFDSIIGISSAIKDSIHQAKEYANSPYNILVFGESGVGKELFAQSIHNYSNRRNGPFIAINCANFPENLIESELFGYAPGAFTGASKNGQAGKFEQANGGTLFLDEIGELPYHFQAKLLRVLETQKLTRIGGNKEINIDVRVVSATNRELEKMIDEGHFRKDLYYRLQVLSVEIPPLRNRYEDIVLLAESFLENIANSENSAPKKLSSGAKHKLFEHTWPGNVRELRNVIHRVSLLTKGDTISEEALDAAINSKGFSIKSSNNEEPESRLQKCYEQVNSAYANLINEALDIAGGNKKNAAELLGVSRQTFYRMLEKYQ